MCLYPFAYIQPPCHFTDILFHEKMGSHLLPSVFRLHLLSSNFYLVWCCFPSCSVSHICLLFAFQVRRLKEFGVTNGELARYLDALLKDSEQLAAMIDNVSSVDNLDFIMESDALGHPVMDQRQGHDSLVAVAGTVTLEEVISPYP